MTIEPTAPHLSVYNPDAVVVNVVTYERHPLFRIRKVMNYSGGRPYTDHYAVQRRLPLPWVDLYLTVTIWTVNKDETRITRRPARLGDRKTAEEIVATKPAFFPRRPKSWRPRPDPSPNPDVAHFNAEGKVVTRG
uniref:Uncharacterized protein n=1 Tax=Caulobacter phage BL57 TaxID=3348355 RepID=A0AB74UIG5_9VIRU